MIYFILIALYYFLFLFLMFFYRVENMSLRLDDMVVKENHLRLTMAALDHRMSRIDEVADSLLHAVSLITSSGRRGRHGGSQDSLDVRFLYLVW